MAFYCIFALFHYGSRCESVNKGNRMPHQKRRNRIALNTLLKKGGKHEKSKKAMRKLEKQQLKGQQQHWPFCLLY